ncbi:MAG: winged helix DNA-binding domain-containing protein, partial [Clostridia bacterium]|nr:winged helix DNA-binding domain-containing protein [Clostridia bacterium]
WGGEALSDEGRTKWAQVILELVDSGIHLREALKDACMEKGMTEAEAECMFESWGGGLREMCERSFLCYRANSRREFIRCPEYVPMGTKTAEKVLMERYLRHYGPVTLRDMAYYFGWNQTKCKAVMQTLECEICSVKTEGKEYFWAGELPEDVPEVPDCIFLAGFDPLMMGYEKKDGFFVPAESLRGIFNLQGMVMSPVLLAGKVWARWKMTGKKLTVTCFRGLTDGEKEMITKTAERMFPKVTKIEFA